eukprot:jgi/Botrbrau1/19302/Bobra.0073s0045.3
MAPQMATTVSVVSILLLIFQVGVKAQTACSAAMQKIMLVPECSQLQTSVGKVAGKLAGASCEVVAATAKEVYGENVPSNCCPGVRAMVEAGCSCDPNFRLLLATVNGFATTEKAADVINGTFALMQAGKCVRPTFGGPVKDPCTGSLGPCGSTPSV